MSQAKGHRDILRSTSIVGGASAVNILIGLVRVKVAALLLGPAGIGLIGLLQSLMTTAAVITACGLNTAGTRQIAEAAARGDARDTSATRRALFWGTLVLASIGALVIVLLRDVLAARVLDGTAPARDVGWMAVGVALTVAAGSQSALLNGLRRIADLAWISIGSAFLSSVLGIGALLLWPEQGVLIFVLSVPLCSFVLGHWFVSRLPPMQAPPTPLSQLTSQWGAMLRLGTAFMVSGLVVNAGQLLTRSLVQRELGTEALGHFQAAWAISMTYIGFVLTAMGTDYYPRLTAVIQDREAVNRLVNEQTEVALLLAGPVFLLMLGIAPWIIEALYSRDFGEAVAILRWQVMGDILKVASWPVGFIILAAGAGRTFMFTESAAIAVYLLFVWLGLPRLGLLATGIGFVVMYAVLLPLVFWIAKARTGLRWDAGIKIYLAALMAVAALIFAAAAFSQTACAIFSVLASAAFAFHGFTRLSAVAQLAGPVAKLARKFSQLTGRAK